MNKYLRPTSVNDVIFLAPNLRQADRNECVAASEHELFEHYAYHILLSTQRISQLDTIVLNIAWRHKHHRRQNQKYWMEGRRLRV